MFNRAPAAPGPRVRIQTEIEGPTERFYRGSPHTPGGLFPGALESGGVVYGLPPQPLAQTIRPLLLRSP
ncbi:MAG: hypothetical protein NZ849_10455 [Meiothermus sp.]|uniref:hypothetical protein n=1 Tax=Meiothermus sp. TaxID=1955249 RepID=UPI0025F1B866|nr:hypothetical protein [Meiothermus sp.]MCS7058492.1 hypothetical protein [Meiothermus sp.]MCS7195310.1 hypothetical protein [Meiothermus sp.]MCX7741010.1 hypothetical protein [Meiothermus sp.]MDW8091655.1 hypothetical protein [Meiothermus sp.]MDW8480970.1 hypothetical protein [Meiothermus sp.]